MSYNRSMKKRKLRCHHCHHLNEVLTYQEVSVDFEPLRDGSLYRHDCEACHTANFFDYPLVVTYADGSIGYKTENQDVTRLVDNQNDLIEKANIFYYHLDDRVIELMKLLLIQRLFKDEVQPIVHFTQTDHQFIEFRIVIDNKYNLMNQPIDAYTTIKDKYEEFFEPNQKVIDQAWAHGIQQAQNAREKH